MRYTTIPRWADCFGRKAGILADCLLGGQALLLSHPAPLTRDTQTFSKIREVAKNKRPGLKKLAEQLLGVQIQAGVHSSVSP